MGLGSLLGALLKGRKIAILRKGHYNCHLTFEAEYLSIRESLILMFSAVIAQMIYFAIITNFTTLDSSKQRLPIQRHNLLVQHLNRRQSASPRMSRNSRLDRSSPSRPRPLPHPSSTNPPTAPQTNPPHQRRGKHDGAIRPSRPPLGQLPSLRIRALAPRHRRHPQHSPHREIGFETCIVE